MVLIAFDGLGCLDVYEFENGVYYAPKFEKVDGAYWFRVVRSCVRPSVHQKRCMLGF